MKIVILAGGKSTRLGDIAKTVSKPFVKIDKESIIEKLIHLFNKYEFQDFIVCCDPRVKLAKKTVNKALKKKNNIKFINTGKNSSTLKRIFKIKNFLDNNSFILVYGDGIADLNIKKLLNSHKKSKKPISMTCYPFTPDKGLLKFSKNIEFYEKSPIKNYWVNIGFFVVNQSLIKMINNKNLPFEEEIVQKYIKKNKVNYFKHKGLWQCLDNPKEYQILKSLFKKKAFGL